MYIPRYLLAGSLSAAVAISSAGCWGMASTAGAYQPVESIQSDQYQDDPGQYAGDADDYDQYDQPVEYANEAPPPLPEYEQPLCPGEGYIWTPGYWYWGSEGFFWVPGAWVYAPYQERCGRRAIGVSGAGGMAGIADSGDATSATTAESITATGTRGMGMRAVVGRETALRTIAQ